MAAEAVRIELLARLTDPGGGLWHPGEVVAFDPEVAARLVERGVARYPVVDGPVIPAVAAPDGPPADKMVRPAGVARKARRWPVR